MTILETARLRLEPYSDAHFDGLQAMNSRPEVMRYISGAPETPEQTRAGIARVQRMWAHFGYSWWAFIEKASGRVAGAGCIQRLRFESELPANLDELLANPLEIGWRLHPDFWRQGLAGEAAQRMARFAFEDLAGEDLYAVCDPENQASARVMQGLGMRDLGLQRAYGIDLATHAVDRATWLAR